MDWESYPGNGEFEWKRTCKWKIQWKLVFTWGRIRFRTRLLLFSGKSIEKKMEATVLLGLVYTDFENHPFLHSLLTRSKSKRFIGMERCKTKKVLLRGLYAARRRGV